MQARRVARAARALALVCALVCLDAARGDPDASTVGVVGSDPESRAFPSLDPPPAPLPSFPTEADTAFAAWLASKGGAFTGAGVWSYVETGRAGDGSIVTGRNRGVFAKNAAVENGDVVFETGLDAALIVPSERAGPILNAVATQVDPEWALAMLLLRESNVGPSGPYAPFLRMALEELDDGRGKAEDSTFFSSSDPRATALTADAVRALRGTYAGAYHDAMVRKDRETFKRVYELTTRKFPVAFPEKTFGDYKKVARALQTVRAKGVRFPIEIVDKTVGVYTAAALVPVAHALPHDPNGAEPCVGVEEEARGERGERTKTRLVVRVAAAQPGEELRCHRGAAVLVPETNERGVSSEEEASRKGERRFRHVSAGLATGALTDAESLFRFGSVGVGRNARDAVVLTLLEKKDFTTEDSDEDDSRASLLKRCGPESSRVLTRDGPSAELWCAVRVATADDDEAAALARRFKEKDTSSDEASRGDKDAFHSAAVSMLRRPVSANAEARALAALLETVAAILDGYPTSDARDEALLRRAPGSSSEEDEEDEDDKEDEDDEEDVSLPLADDVAEAVRCRLREKRLLLDALNGLQRAASTTLPADVRLDVVAGDGASLGVAADASTSPPGGFQVKKAAYEKEL
jgi:hypothetical protein